MSTLELFVYKPSQDISGFLNIQFHRPDQAFPLDLRMSSTTPVYFKYTLSVSDVKNIESDGCWHDGATGHDNYDHYFMSKAYKSIAAVKNCTVPFFPLRYATGRHRICQTRRSGRHISPLIDQCPIVKFSQSSLIFYTVFSIEKDVKVVIFAMLPALNYDFILCFHCYSL